MFKFCSKKYLKSHSDLNSGIKYFENQGSRYSFYQRMLM